MPEDKNLRGILVAVDHAKKFKHKKSLGKSAANLARNKQANQFAMANAE